MGYMAFDLVMFYKISNNSDNILDLVVRRNFVYPVLIGPEGLNCTAF